MRKGRRRGGLFGLLRLAPVMVGGFVAALMIGGAATGALLTSSEGSDTEPPASVAGADRAALALLAAELTLSKTAPETVALGEFIDYVITVTNDGDEAATNVRVTDELPAAAEFFAVNDEATFCVRDGQDIECIVPRVEPDGGTVTWTIRARANEPGTIENTALLHRLDQEPLPASASTLVTADAAIEITKIAPGTATAGEMFQYDLAVANVGDVGLNDMRVVDDLPDSLEFVEFVGATGDACDEEGGVVTCGPDTLSPGTIFHFEFRVRAAAAGDVVNTASVTVKRDDGETLQDSDSATTTVSDEEAVVDLALDKSAPTTAVIGGTFTYTLRVDNNGGTDVDDVEVEDELPDGVAFAGSDDDCEPVEGIVTCAVGTVLADNSESVSFDVTASTAGTKTNTATVDATGDANPGDNSDSATTVISDGGSTLPDGAVISNGTVRLGVVRTGNVNFGGFGVNYVPTGHDGTRAGCSCEGWGAGANGPAQFQGRANNSEGFDGVRAVSFESTASTATSVVDVLRGATPGLRVTHEFVPSPQTPNLYQITVKLRNVADGTLSDVRYAREMDWDVEPTAFSEFVTINRGAPPASLVYSDDNGFADNYPFTADGPQDPSTENASYVDKGPDDHGARFIFTVGDLAPGEEKTLVLFYGAAGTEAAANAAVSAAALEVFSYGQTSSDPTGGTPNTFIWGFRAVGGAPVIPPTVSVSPKTFTGTVGVPRTVTVTVTASDGKPVPGAPVVFQITGANASSPSTGTTGTDGTASFTYTALNAGTDSITVCLDGDGNGSCGASEIADTATHIASTSPIVVEADAVPTQVGNTRTVRATVTEDGTPVEGASVHFEIVSGPHAGTTFDDVTDAGGIAVFSYTGLGAGTDIVEASYTDDAGNVQRSERVSFAWFAPTPPPTGGGDGGGGGGGGSATTTTTTTTAPPLPPLPPPTNPQELNARVVMGQVLVNGQPFTGASLKVGDVVDTTRGTLELRSTTGSLLVYDGAFRYTLDGTVAQFELVGGDFSICQSARRAAGRAADERPVRRLWGKGTGSFKTKARYSSATVRGTTWLTEDRCDGTLIQSDEGTVEVYDYSLRRLLLVAAGNRYLAQAPPPPTPGSFVGDPTGTVLINGQPVTQDTQVRNGDTVDVRNGRLLLRTTSGEATFYSGRFIVTQPNSRTAFTLLRLVGGNFATACGANRRVAAVDKDKPKKAKRKKNTAVVRSLWGDGAGKFRTQARYSSATVRGTVWLTVDRCDGSLVRVVRGRVEVRDLTQRKTVFVNSGGQYLAPAPG